jgi:ABC-type branched-subunit amino acid transport system substrate-binding protein
MKLIIAGGRHYKFTSADVTLLDDIMHNRNNVIYGVHEIITGGATGADTEALNYAQANNIPCKVFKADWARYDKAAGAIRNKIMADYADAVLLFPGGRGTNNMYKFAVEYGLTIFDYRT